MSGGVRGESRGDSSFRLERAYKKAAVSEGEQRLFELPNTLEESFLVVIGGLEPPTPAL